ncbi:MAG: murein biosynthesis integral membrane protein MurJ [Tissierellia bacterium]|nr:murein biosynthesis integral membrane protein MurJ [Tissierellia bacterium]
MKRNLARSSIVIVVIGILSKIMGTVRTSLIARSFGQSMETDAYYAAYKGAMLSMIVINVTINSVLIPIMAKAKEEKGIQGKNFFFNNFNTIAIIINILLALLTAGFAPLLAGFLVAGGSRELMALTIRLIRIMSPSVVFMGFVYAIGAYQQSIHRFAPFAAIGIINNLAFYVYLIPKGIHADIIHLAYITVVGAGLQLVFISFFNGRNQLKIRPIFQPSDPYIRNYILLAIPIFMASGFNQMNHFVTDFLASYLEEGVITTIGNSYRLFSAILQLVAATIATVVYPTLSEAYTKKDEKTLSSVVDNGFEAIVLIMVPITIAMIVFSDPIVQIVYERGKFTAYDTYLTKTAFTLYAVGLLGHGLKQYLNRVFYSGQDTFRPMLIQGISVFLNIALAFIMVRFIGFRALPLSQALAGIGSAILLLILLSKQMTFISLWKYSVVLIKAFLASVIMGITTGKIYGLLTGGVKTSNPKVFLYLILCGMIGVPLYFVICHFMGFQSLKQLKKMISNKIKGNQKKED